MNIELYKFNKSLKKLLSTYLIVLTVGVLCGLLFLNSTTSFSSKGAIERFKGSDVVELDDEIDFNISYEKSLSEMLMTTHNHVLGFSFIFISLGIIFYFNSIIVGFWKNFLIVEPFVSILVSFGSIWGMRFIDENFVYITIISASLLYLSYFIIAGVSFYELVFKR